MAPQAPPDDIAAIQRPCPALMKYYVLKALATALAAPLTLLVLYFRFHTMRYRFDAEGIHMAWGIIKRNEIMLNYSRIQDIHLQSNVVERWLGLARIEIQTASGGERSDMTLEGIAEYAAMRDFLYSRMRGARHEHEVGAAAPSVDSLAAILTEVAGELRAIRTAMERHDA
jgi:putative membrane protein